MALNRVATEPHIEMPIACVAKMCIDSLLLIIGESVCFEYDSLKCFTFPTTHPVPGNIGQRNTKCVGVAMLLLH